MKLQEVKNPKPIAIYPGRFQPMGLHHFKAYQNLVKKFGAKNVYIATSGVTGPKSPFTFAEKKKIIQAYGVPSNRIIKVKDPYKAVEITSKLPEDTPVVFGFGAKDAGRLTSGKYFRDYKEGDDLVGYKENGYITVLPHIALKVGGKEMSGTSIRAALGSKETEESEKLKVFKGIFGHSKKDIYKLVVDKLTSLREEKMELRRLLLMGGAYGHMAHPFDDSNLTFGDFKSMITRLLKGGVNVEGVTEKLDGQNLMVSWKNGQLVAARNKGQIKNFGENSLTTAGVKKMFAGRGELEKAFAGTMEDLENAIKGLTEKQKGHIFDNGHKWMNLEIIYVPTQNVIPYGKDMIIFHGNLEYDKEGNAIGQDKESGSKLAGMIKQINQDIQNTFEIRGPVALSLPVSKDFKEDQQYFIKKLSKLQKQYGLSNNDKVTRYHEMWWLNKINAEARKAKIKLDKKTKNVLINRWVFGNKSTALNSKNFTNEKVLAWAKKLDKQNFNKFAQQNIAPFEDLFLELGAKVLTNVENLISASPENSVRSIKKDLKTTINSLRQGGDINKITQLKRHLTRLQKAGGFKRIVPSEGLVFNYKGKTYKLTGTFAPINQILGSLKYA
tara:strand:+ start:10021 stop:11853 length:1833 start_codon:yes stop_codon:yes gene_type:complete